MHLCGFGLVLHSLIISRQMASAQAYLVSSVPFSGYVVNIRGYCDRRAISMGCEFNVMMLAAWVSYLSR